MKFWNKSADSADIFIYGDITSERWDEAETTAKSFVEDLKSCNSSPVTIHINSSGGDCFQALAIHNQIKQYSGAVNVSIEGLCASAATIIACAADSVTMADNSLMMIHNPSVGLAGYFDESDVVKIANSLSAVKSSILSVYNARTGKSDEELSALMSSETWYTAAEAVENNFADEIAGEISAQFDDAKKILFVNKLSVDCRKFDCGQLRDKIYSTAIERTDTMDEKSILSKIKDLLSGKKAVEVEEPMTAEQIRGIEMTRIQSLAKMRDGTAAVDAIVDLAIRDGEEILTAKKYVDAVKKSSAATEKTTQAILNLIEDNLKSGAEGVTGSAEEVTDADKRKAQAALIAKFANGQV